MAPPWLSEEWFDDARRVHNELQPERPGVSGTVNVSIAGGPDGEVRCYVEVRDAKVVACGLGTLDDADCAVTTTFADAQEMHAGRLEPSVAYMQGRLKVTGDMRVWLSVLRLSAGPAWRAWSEPAAG